jgi:hypothetical protein
VLVWAAGPHEPAPSSGFPGTGLYGNPTPVFASVREAGGAGFQAPHTLSASAVYAEGTNPSRQPEGIRVLGAIGAGRALVAWPAHGPAGPVVETALYAGRPGCTPSTAPAPGPSAGIESRARIQWSRRPRLHRHRLILGSFTCAVACSGAVSVVVRSGKHRHAYTVARSKLKASGARRETLTAILTKRGRRLVHARPRLRMWAAVTLAERGVPVTSARRTPALSPKRRRR